MHCARVCTRLSILRIQIACAHALVSMAHGVSCFFLIIGVILLASAQERKWAPRTSPFSLRSPPQVHIRSRLRPGRDTYVPFGRHAIHIAPPASGHQTGTQTTRAVPLTKPVVGAHVDDAEGHSATCPFSRERAPKLWHPGPSATPPSRSLARNLFSTASPRTSTRCFTDARAASS